MIINSKETTKNILEQKRIELEHRDYRILKTRDKKYIPVKIKNRTILTEFGPLKFRRRIYKFLNPRENKWKYTALLDEELGIRKWQKLDDEIVKKIENQISKNKRYVDITDMFPYVSISRMTVTNIFKKMKTTNYWKVKPIELKKGQIVYINLDDTFPKVRKRRKRVKLRTRIVTFHLGINTKTRRTIHKRFCFLLNLCNAEAVAQFIVKMGRIFYKNFEDCKWVIGGDGAQWIKATAEYLRAEWVLDKYHGLKVLREKYMINSSYRMQNPENWKKYEKAASYFCNGNYEKLIKTLKSAPKPFATKYFTVNKNGITTYSKKWNVGVSAESDVSRLVKSSYGYGSRIYSYAVLKKILIQKAYNFNQA